MQAHELSRISEIDRAEVIRVGYEIQRGELISKAVIWDSPNFEPGGDGEHSVAAQIDFCRSHMERGAIAIGGFDGRTLAAIGVLTPNIRPGMAQLAYLHVSAPYRRGGIASEIARRLLAHARAVGSRRVYVSATPSQSAVGFYRFFGFEFTEEPLAELLELEPVDIHMILELEEEEPVGSA